MKDFLKFLDSEDIRNFHKDTVFTPAEQAILISKSQGTTLEEKLEALRDLAEHYSEEDFKDGFYNADMTVDLEKTPFRTLLLETICNWETAMNVRYQAEGYIFGAFLQEKEYSSNLKDMRYFTDYEMAYAFLQKEKQYYLDKEDLRDVETFAQICRFKLDTNVDYIGYDTYYFDNQMRLVEATTYEYQGELYDISECNVWLPVPFKAGDIVKCSTPFSETIYGVIPYDWNKPLNKDVFSMIMSLDMYYEKERAFDFTDDTIVLTLSYCTDEELPEDEKMLKQIRKVRKEGMDFMCLLYKYTYCHEG